MGLVKKSKFLIFVFWLCVSPGHTANFSYRPFRNCHSRASGNPVVVGRGLP